MKRMLLALTTVLTLPACGMYTNVPAQVQVVTVKPARVTYTTADAAGKREIQVENAEVTLRGDLGSIGVTYDPMTVRYYKSAGTQVEANLISPLTTYLTMRVESSNFPSSTTEGVELAQTGQKVVAGQSSVALPVVTRHVEDYGMSSSTNASMITAEVTWNGTDDAGFPSTLIIHVPITFHGAPGSGS